MSRKAKEINVTGITKDELQALYDHWVKFSSCYFWSPPGSAGGRRSEERKHYRRVFFEVNGVPIAVEIEVTCSCKNYYCNRDCHVGDTRKAQGGRYLRTLLEKGAFCIGYARG